MKGTSSRGCTEGKEGALSTHQQKHFPSSSRSPYCFLRNSSIYLSSGHFTHIKSLHSYPWLWSNPGITRHDLFNMPYTRWSWTCQPGSLHTLCTSVATAAAPAPSAKAALAQFTALAQPGSPCKVLCCTALKYKQHSLCHEQHKAHPRQCAAATELLVCWKWFHHTSFFLWGHPRPEKSSKGLCKRKRRGRNEEREKGKPFTGHWIRAVTWPWLRLATNSINYKQLPFSSSCQK